MNRASNPSEQKYDKLWLQNMGSGSRLIYLVFRPLFIRFAKSVLCRSFERGHVDSFVFHEQCGIVDRMLDLERRQDHK